MSGVKAFIGLYRSQSPRCNSAICSTQSIDASRAARIVRMAAGGIMNQQRF